MRRDRAAPALRAGAIRVAWTAALGLLCGTAPARAHLVSTGMGPVFDGVSHLLLSLDDLLPVVALALLAGLNGPVAGRRVLFLLPGSWLAAGGVGFWVSGALSSMSESAAPALLAAFSLIVLGVLTAAARPLPAGVVTVLALALGAMHGLFNGASLAAVGRPLLALSGIAVTIFVLVALLAALVLRLRAAWTRVAVRVAGSWLAAIGLLLLGWALRGA